MTLGEFLTARAASTEPWNCSTMAADWCVALGYPDFAADWRGIVDDAECETVQREAGGLLVLWAQGIGEGLPHAPDPLRAGDIAVVAVRGHEAGAIWAGQRWAIQAERCLHFIGADGVDVLGAWRP